MRTSSRSPTISATRVFTAESISASIKTLVVSKDARWASTCTGTYCGAHTVSETTMRRGTTDGGTDLPPPVWDRDSRLSYAGRWRCHVANPATHIARDMGTDCVRRLSRAGFQIADGHRVSHKTSASDRALPRWGRGRSLGAPRR